MDAAWNCLREQNHERGMDAEVLAKKRVDRAFTDSNSSRLQALVAKFEKAIQAHHAHLAASMAALAALSPVTYSENIQERDIVHEAPPAAENAAPFLTSEISTDSAREAPALNHLCRMYSSSFSLDST